MADSGATRARRARAHAKGDHSQCRPEGCRVVLAAGLSEMTEDRQPAQPGSVEAALALFAASIPASDADPRRVIVECGLRLARAVDEANGREVAGIARELRMCLSFAAGFGQEANPLDAVRATYALRRVDSALARFEST